MNQIGLFGVGAMGLPILRNLLAAGHEVAAVDLDPARIREAGIEPADPAEAARREVVILCIRGTEATIGVAENTLLPVAREGQILIDTGTVRPSATRRVAEAFAKKGATWLDCPMSGGTGGVERKTLRVFVGGDQAAFERARPVLADYAGNDMLYYCGPSGSGQIVKGVNQLMMGVVNAAHMEAVAYGVNLGVDPALLSEAVGGNERWRSDLKIIADKAAKGDAKWENVKYHELPAFIAEAREAGFPLPLTEAVMAVCHDDLPKTIVDFGKPAPSFWDAITGENGES